MAHDLLSVPMTQAEAEKKIREWLRVDPVRPVSLTQVWSRNNLHTFHIPGVTIEQVRLFLENGGVARMFEDRWPYAPPEI